VHRAGDLQHVFGARLVGSVICLACVRIDPHLHQPRSVAQIDEDQAAMIAPLVHPPGQGDLLADVRQSQFTAVNRFDHAAAPESCPVIARSVVCDEAISRGDTEIASREALAMTRTTKKPPQ
jgi:hypothetical protein